MTHRNLLAALLGVSFSMSATLVTAADMAAGEKVFKKCKVCHTLEEGGKKKIGPNLFGIMGRVSGVAEGFKYSKAMKAAGVTWDIDTLTQYLTKPKEFIPGNKMAFPGLKKPQDMENLMAYVWEKTK